MAGNDLHAGFWLQQSPVYSLLGNVTNVVDTSRPAYTNYLPGMQLANVAAAGSGICLAAPVAVDVGATITNVVFISGGVAASTPTHGFAALYQGTGASPSSIVQTADFTTTAVAANTVFTKALTAATVITSTMAPDGFIYVSISWTATTVPNLQTYSTPTATQAAMPWFTGAPLFTAATHGSGVAGTAPATITGSSTAANAPIFVLT